MGAILYLFPHGANKLLGEQGYELALTATAQSALFLIKFLRCIYFVLMVIIVVIYVTIATDR